ncbi:hypothetical protein DRJ25_05360 [Candidatus Woesearchaeota archaeon]|nr:MAG: hypothetical protein DRJ25_05360 [Candidatus Woesearchaeota archaeon]
MKYVYFEFKDGAYCRSDHLDSNALALFRRGVGIAKVEVRHGISVAKRKRQIRDMFNKCTDIDTLEEIGRLLGA